MDNNTLLGLRQQIVEGAQQLALAGTGAPYNRLQVLLEIIRSGTATQDAIETAFRLTKELDDDESKLNATLDLLYEVDQLIAANEVGSHDESSNQDTLQS